MHGVLFINAGKDSNEIVFECLYCLFGSISTVHVGRYFFIHHSSFCDEFKEVIRTLVVYDVFWGDDVCCIEAFNVLFLMGLTKIAFELISHKIIRYLFPWLDLMENMPVWLVYMICFMLHTCE